MAKSSFMKIILILFITIISIFLHITSFFIEKYNRDMGTWIIVAKAIKNLEDPYYAAWIASNSPPFYAFVYPPAWAFLCGALAFIIDPLINTTLYLILLRIILMICNLFTAFIIMKSMKSDVLYFSLFILNPIIIGMAQGGYFDIIATLFALLSIKYLKNYKLSAILLGLGISIKIWPILLLPFLFLDKSLNKKRCKFLFLSLLPTLLMSIPFYSSNYFYKSIFTNLSRANPSRPSPEITYSLFLIIYIILFLLAIKYKLSLLECTTLILTAFLIILPSNLSYLIWILPFILISINKYGKIMLIPYLLISFSSILMRYYSFMVRHNIIFIQYNTLEYMLLTGESLTFLIFLKGKLHEHFNSNSY
jgi:uncharacterized membrane protein